jgi:tRNA(fMet)-specific endonuclease VapC
VGVILDTSLIIAAEHRAARLDRYLDSLGDEPIALSAITASELLHGCHRATDAGVRARRAAFVEAILEAAPVLPFALAEARRHAELWAELMRRGTMIGPHDLLIGATALARGYKLATLNRRDFERIPGLQLETIGPFLS